MAMAMCKDDILKASDLPTASVDVPEWGTAITLRTMSGAERDQWEDAWTKYRLSRFGTDETARDWKAFLIVHTAVGVDGKPLFTEADIPALNGKSARVLDLLSKVAMRINSVGGDEVERLAKNCVGGRSAEPG